MSSSRLLVIAGAALGVALVLLVVMDATPTRAAGSVCVGSTCTLTHTTTDDFVLGNFYAAGLRKNGDGEVQLLPMGLTGLWTSGTALPEPRAELAAVTYNNILYAIGGQDGTTTHTEIYSATTNVTGTITAGWALADELPAPRNGAAAVISPTTTGGVLYVIGGGISAPTDTIFYKSMTSNGAFTGSWATTTLPTVLTKAGAIVRGGYLYVVGGSDKYAPVNTVYRYPIVNASGDLGPYDENDRIPTALREIGVVTWSGPSADYLYLIGGTDEFDTASKNVNVARFNADGSIAPASWTTSTLLNAFTSHSVIQANGAIHMIGGNEGVDYSTAITKVQSALIQPDGQLHYWEHESGNWVVTTPLPQARFSLGAVINLGGEIYALGGFDNTGAVQNTVYHGSTTGDVSGDSTKYYAPVGNYVSAPFDIGTNTSMTALKWNAIVSDTSAMKLTIQYRAAETVSGLASLPWQTAGDSVQSSTGTTNTFTLSPNRQNHYLQYRALFTTTLPHVSPVLNWVQLEYLGLPDFAVSYMVTPPQRTGVSSPVSMTINVAVSNIGPYGFNKNTRSQSGARVGQGGASRAATRARLQSLARTAAYTGTTSYFSFVEVYIDREAPTSPSDVGNCPAMSGGTNWGWVYALTNGETAIVPVTCYIVPTSPHTFYALVDSCDDPGGQNCSASYGYVYETDETNNKFGPVASGTGTILNLPMISK